MPITPDVVEHTAKWMVILRDDWTKDIPIRMHSVALDAGGAPQWSPELKSWLADKDGPRYRMTKAMRRLRRVSVREFEVAYRMIILSEPIDHTTAWLNDRAIRNAKPERYSVTDTRTIIVSAVDKLLAWY